LDEVWTPPSSRQDASPATRRLSLGISTQDEPHLAAIAKRFSAVALSVGARMSVMMESLGG
jgi:hypothetical protein